jgi:hypothetical protein
MDDWARAATEWGLVLRRLAEGRPPSKAHLARLGDVPDWATAEEREALDAILRTGPGKRPARAPKDWGLFGEFSAREADVLMALRYVHNQLASYRTTNVRVGRSGRRFRWLKGGGLPLVRVERPHYWRIARPKEHARRLVARHYRMAPETLRDLEKRFRATPWLGEVF